MSTITLETAKSYKGTSTDFHLYSVPPLPHIRSESAPSKPDLKFRAALVFLYKNTNEILVGTSQTFNISEKMIWQGAARLSTRLRKENLAKQEKDMVAMPIGSALLNMSYNLQITIARRKRKENAAKAITKLVFSSTERVRNAALDNLFTIANSENEFAAQLGLSKFGEIILNPNGEMSDMAFGKLKSLVLMNYRPNLAGRRTANVDPSEMRLDPGRDYSAEITAIEKADNITGSAKRERISLIRKQQLSEPVAINDLEQTRFRAGRFLIQLLEEGNEKLNSKIWTITEYALNNKRGELQDVGIEMIRVAKQSKNDLIVQKAEQINSIFEIRNGNGHSNGK